MARIDESWHGRIVCDPELHHGEPCIKGTRIPVSILVASLAEMTFEKLLEEYPQLTKPDLQAALYYASEASHNSWVA
jgi:uncharacterized protein (DUF433 family)